MNGHCNHLALKFSLCVKERQDRLPTMYWLPKLHKRPYKARFIANSSSCTKTELSREEIASALNNFGNRWCKREYVEPNALKEWKVSIFKTVDQRIKFYSQNTNLYPINLNKLADI